MFREQSVDPMQTSANVSFPLPRSWELSQATFRGDLDAAFVLRAQITASTEVGSFVTVDAFGEAFAKIVIAAKYPPLAALSQGGSNAAGRRSLIEVGGDSARKRRSDNKASNTSLI